MASRTPGNRARRRVADRLHLQVQDLVQAVHRHQGVLELQVHRGQPLQRLQQVARAASRRTSTGRSVSAPAMTRWPPYQRTTSPARAVTNIAQRVHAQAELLQGERRLDQADQALLPLLGPPPLGPERLDRLHAGDVLDQVGGEPGGLLHRLAGPPPGGRVVGRHADAAAAGRRPSPPAPAASRRPRAPASRITTRVPSTTAVVVVPLIASRTLAASPTRERISPTRRISKNRRGSPRMWRA